MVCFPRDNKEYTADALGAWCGTRTRGVFSDDNHYAVTSNGDMTVTVSPGLAWLKMDDYWGVCALEANEQTFTIDIADGSLPRVDVVCVRLDKNDDAGDGVVIKKGATSPQPPQITPPVRDLDYDEIYVASIRVRAGATAIMPDDITDLRMDENYCGVMRDGVTGIPTQMLYDSFMAWMESLKDILDEEVAGHLLLMIEDLQGEVVRIDGELALRPYTVTTENMTYYISVSGSDVMGDGSETNPFATVNYAMSLVPKIINHNINIILMPGAYHAAINLSNISGTGTLAINGTSSPYADWVNTVVARINMSNVTCNFQLNYFTVYSGTTTAQYCVSLSRCANMTSCRIGARGYNASNLSIVGVHCYQCQNMTINQLILSYLNYGVLVNQSQIFASYSSPTSSRWYFTSVTAYMRAENGSLFACTDNFLNRNYVNIVGGSVYSFAGSVANTALDWFT